MHFSILSRVAHTFRFLVPVFEMFNSSSGGSPSSTLEDCATCLLNLLVTSWRSGPSSTSLHDGITRVNQLPDSIYQKLPATQKFLVFISDKPPRESSRFIPKMPISKLHLTFLSPAILAIFEVLPRYSISRSD